MVSLEGMYDLTEAASVGQGEYAKHGWGSSAREYDSAEVCGTAEQNHSREIG
jgi:hypothetical protein